MSDGRIGDHMTTATGTDGKPRSLRITRSDRLRRRIPRAIWARNSQHQTKEALVLRDRHLLESYRATQHLPIRRFLLRDLSSRRVDVDPDEAIDAIRSHDDVTEPHRLRAEAWIQEQLLRIRLCPGDTISGATGAPEAPARRRLHYTPQHPAREPLLAGLAHHLLQRPPDDVRSRVLVALGNLEPEWVLPLLTRELTDGEQPGSAAIGLSRLENEEAAGTLLLGVQARGLERSIPWLGSALMDLACESTAPLLTRMARSSDERAREEAAIALGSFAGLNLEGHLDAFGREQAPLVRLNLIKSVGMLSGTALDTLAAFLFDSDHAMFRVTAIQSATRIPGDEARSFLERALGSDKPHERAVALAGLIHRGELSQHHFDDAREASESTHTTLCLMGLLALIELDADSAFSRVADMLRGGRRSSWVIATHALGFLESKYSIEVLTRLHELGKGSELGSVAICALARHVHREGALPALGAVASGSTDAATVTLVVREVLRHIPADLEVEAFHLFENALLEQPAPDCAGPLLIAIGALGRSDALPRLVDGAQRAPREAIRGMELLGDPAAIETLRGLATHDDTAVRSDAITALLRLGELSAVELARELSRVDGTAGVETFCQMALSIRALGDIPRLTRLETVLGTPGASRTPPTDADAGGAIATASVAATRSLNHSAGMREPDGFPRAGVPRLRPVTRDTAPQIPVLAPADRGTGVVRALGDYMRSPGLSGLLPRDPAVSSMNLDQTWRFSGPWTARQATCVMTAALIFLGGLLAVRLKHQHVDYKVTTRTRGVNLVEGADVQVLATSGEIRARVGHAAPVVVSAGDRLRLPLAISTGATGRLVLAIRIRQDQLILGPDSSVSLDRLSGDARSSRFTLYASELAGSCTIRWTAGNPQLDMDIMDGHLLAGRAIVHVEGQSTSTRVSAAWRDVTVKRSKDSLRLEEGHTMSWESGGPFSAPVAFDSRRVTWH
jgi:HEAT repeat protein